MKLRFTLSALAFFAAFVYGSASAAVRVTDLYLQKNSQFTEVTIVCDAPAEFTHQIVEATANKPYRIVVDVQNAVTAMLQQSFQSLPSGSIRQIRTSQYSTEPAKIVRIVLDVSGTLTYKVKGAGSTFTLYINTPTDKDFPKWSATSGGATTTVAVAKPEPTVRTTVAPKVEPTAATVASVKNEAPKQMPLHPDKPAAPVKAVAEGNMNDSKLATKPIDESKLLTKVTKSEGTTSQHSTPAAATAAVVRNNQPVAQVKTANEPVKPVEKATKGMTSQQLPGDSKAATRSDKTASPQPKGATPSIGSEAGATKRADSSTMPQLKPSQSTPPNEPKDTAKPPKVQKTALPETKVVKTQKYTESPEAGNALTGKIATALEGGKVADVRAGDVAKDTVATTGADLSKGEAVRQRYLASRDRNLPPEPALPDSMAMAGSESAPALTEIDRIRLKYKRGIKFVQNDRDEQQQASGDTMQMQESDQSGQNIGVYGEFLPEREIVVYQTSGHADPFMPLVEEATTSSGNGELPDVETLRLVGILQDKKASRALFEDYNGFSFILRTGDRVKNGFVLSIEDTRVLFQIRQYGWNRQVAVDLESE